MADKKFSFASKFNKTSFGIDTTDFTFVKLTDLFNSPRANRKSFVRHVCAHRWHARTHVYASIL